MSLGLILCPWCRCLHSITDGLCDCCGHAALKPQALCTCENCTVLNGDFEPLITVADLFTDNTTDET